MKLFKLDVGLAKALPKGHRYPKGRKRTPTYQIVLRTQDPPLIRPLKSDPNGHIISPYQVLAFAERRIEAIEQGSSITSIKTYQTNTKNKLTVGWK